MKRLDSFPTDYRLSVLCSPVILMLNIKSSLAKSTSFIMTLASIRTVNGGLLTAVTSFN